MENNMEIYTPGFSQFDFTRKLCNLVFLVDITVGIHKDSRIENINEAFLQMIPILRQIQMDDMSEIEYKISIMIFDQDSYWHVLPTTIMEYDHILIHSGGKEVNYEKAFIKLNEKLTKKEFFAHDGKFAEPIIVLLMGSEMGESGYDDALKSLYDNGWFKASRRYAVFADKAILNSKKVYEFCRIFVTDYGENIIHEINKNTLSEIIMDYTDCRWRNHHILTGFRKEEDISDSSNDEIFYDPEAIVQEWVNMDFKDEDFI